MDKIRIENLEIFANHGVFPEENRLGQKFLVSMELAVNTREAGLKDDLERSVDYGEVCHFASDFLKNHTYRLIEAASERLALELLLKYKPVRGVRLAVKKPWAPIGLPLEGVSVEIVRTWHKVYLALGSNMGDKKQYIARGIERLGALEKCRVLSVSDLIETKPYGVTDQDDFVNGCLEMETLYTPEELLDKLHEIENEADRKRERRWGPRTLDLDILLYDSEIIQTPELIVPHTDMANRHFVLEPLAQIAPYVVHPVFLKTARQMLLELKNRNRKEDRDEDGIV